MAFKLISIILITIALVFLWAQWWFFPTKWEQYVQMRMEYRKFMRGLERAFKREVKRILGGLPKQTPNGIRVGKRVFKSRVEFARYCDKCFAEEKQRKDILENGK